MLLSIYELEAHWTVDTAADVRRSFCLRILCNGNEDITVKVLFYSRWGG